jgi:phospholipid N-methyltransferase
MNALRRSGPREVRGEARGLFLRDFLRRPRQVASVIPSSRFLERRIVRSARLGSARLVVELGPGTGGTTRAILRSLPRDARLLCVEINPRFARVVAEAIDDPRLIVHSGDARHLPAILEKHGLGPADVVFSGIPFSTMPRELGLEVLRSVRSVLAPGGRFVAYQVRDRVGSLGRQVFGEPEVETELLNVPPVRVFRWENAAARH